MKTPPHRTYPVTQLACIVNLLHRMAIHTPSEALPAGMTVAQLSTIGFLYFSQNEEVYQRDIETFFKLRRSTISSQLNTLEKKGLIQRVPVAHDARLKKLVLTQDGMEASAHVMRILAEMNRLLVQGLSQEEVDQLSRLLGKIEENLSREAP